MTLLKDRTEKLCKKCAQTKPIADFYSAGKTLDARCKPCHAQYVKQYREDLRSFPEARIDILVILAEVSGVRKSCFNPDVFRVLLSSGDVSVNRGLAYLTPQGERKVKSE